MLPCYALDHVRSVEFYHSAVKILETASVPFLVGGAFALRTYTGIDRDTKDFDVMMKPADVPRALEAFRQAGFAAAVAFPHWLAKARHGEFFIDIIFRAGNGLCEVDDDWFRYAPTAEIFGQQLPICPAEEIIWQKAYIMERERFDGADVQHLLLSRGAELDWPRLLARFGPDWRVLLSHLVLFGFVYPSEREAIPESVLQCLYAKLSEERGAAPSGRICGGTLLSRTQYLPDVERWRFADARLDGRARVTVDELQVWTNAIDRSECVD